MKIRNLSLILLTSIAITSCSYFSDDEDMYTASNDPLVNRSEESLPLDKELQRVTGETNTSPATNEQAADTVNAQPLEIKPVTLNTTDTNKSLKESIRELNMAQAQPAETVESPAITTAKEMPASMAVVSVKPVTGTAPLYVSETQAVASPVVTKTEEVNNDVITEQPKQEPVEGEDMPKISGNEPQVGQCYGKVKIEGTYKTVSEEVVVQAESTRTEVRPAKYDYKNEDVVVREESFKYVQIPATYKTVNEEVIVEPERKQVITIPAQYSTVTERVMVKPAKKVWKKGRGLIEKPGEDGEVMCLREEPAVYENVTKQVVTSPERTETRVVPAVKKVISKQVVDQPARVEKVAIPAVKTTVQRKIVTEPEQTRTVTIPAVKKVVQKKVPLTEDRVEWAPIVCNDNLRPELIAQIQTALVGKGYSVAQDGHFGKETAAALDKYQRSLGYESTGIALQTMKQLGIAY